VKEWEKDKEGKEQKEGMEQISAALNHLEGSESQLMTFLLEILYGQNLKTTCWFYLAEYSATVPLSSSLSYTNR
jgi:hypothetical protein